MCDDEKEQNAYISSLLKRWARQRGFSIQISAFESAEQFLFFYAEHKTFDLVLLDIQMKEINGVELAKKIRAEGDGAELVFITGFPDFMAEGYEVSALHYLLKPIREEKLYEALDKAAAKRESRPRTLLLPQKGGAVRLRADEIVYAEVFSHTTTLYLTSGGTLTVNMRLSDMEALLGDGFFKCHRSYIVSLAHMRRVTRLDIELDDGRRLPLSRNLYVEANKAFIKYN